MYKVMSITINNIVQMKVLHGLLIMCVIVSSFVIGIKRLRVKIKDSISFCFLGFFF